MTDYPDRKINKAILDLSYMLDQMVRINIYRTFHPTVADYTLFSSAHTTFPRIDHMLVHKTNHNKFKNEIALSIFWDHSCLKLEISKKTGKFTNI